MLAFEREITMSNDRHPTAPMREVPVDWEALEDAFENNAPEVHSYLHLTTGEVLRVVDGVADPQMHARISADPNYNGIDPDDVSVTNINSDLAGVIVGYVSLALYIILAIVFIGVFVSFVNSGVYYDYDYS